MNEKLDLKNAKTLSLKQHYFESNRPKKHDKLNDWGAISHRSNKYKRVIFKDSFTNTEIMKNNIGIKSSYDLDK